MDKKNNHQGLYRVAYICYSEVEKENSEILDISKREEEYI
jgi:hypothetical protein